MPVHVAETRQEALDDTRDGAAAFLLDYTQAVTGRPSPVPGPRERIVDQMVEAGAWAIGTPDDAIAAIERLQERSGGFGGLMITGTDWAPREKVLRSYELLARHVMPRFQGSLAGIEASNAVARERARDHGRGAGGRRRGRAGRLRARPRGALTGLRSGPPAWCCARAARPPSRRSAPTRGCSSSWRSRVKRAERAQRRPVARHRP